LQVLNPDYTVIASASEAIQFLLCLASGLLR